MILKKYITLFFLCTGFFSVSQQSSCENSDSEFVALNTVGKCSIEKFKKSENKEYVKVAIRKRFVRKRNNSYLTNLKENLKSVTTESTNKSNANPIKEKVVISSEEKLIHNYTRFDKVYEIPVFITCKNADLATKQSCVKETFVNNILENLIYPFDAAAAGIEGVVWVRFIVDTGGYVKNITTKGPEDGVLLEKEAKRLITLLPKFIPGRSDDSKYVNVEYFMPIDFQLDE